LAIINIVLHFNYIFINQVYVQCYIVVDFYLKNYLKKMFIEHHYILHNLKLKMYRIKFLIKFSIKYKGDWQQDNYIYLLSIIDKQIKMYHI